MLKLKPQTKFGKYFHFFPIVIMIVLLTLIIIFRKSITVDNILNFTPENHFLAALAICGMFVLKGLSVMFPGTVLYVITGMIFPRWAALLVACVGTALEIAVTYYMGVLCGETRFIANLQRKPKFQQLFHKGQKNERMLVYLSRILGLPYDVMGMFWGAVGAKFVPYMIFSMLGKLPKVVVETIIGVSVGDKFSMSNIVILIVLVAVTLAITLVSNKLSKEK